MASIKPLGFSIDAAALMLGGGIILAVSFIIHASVAQEAGRLYMLLGGLTILLAVSAIIPLTAVEVQWQ